MSLLSLLLLSKKKILLTANFWTVVYILGKQSWQLTVWWAAGQRMAYHKTIPFYQTKDSTVACKCHTNYKLCILSLTVVEINVFRDLVPGPVVEMPHLLLVLHHTCRFTLLLIFKSNIVLNSFKILPMLWEDRKENDRGKVTYSCYPKDLMKYKNPSGEWQIITY